LIKSKDIDYVAVGRRIREKRQKLDMSQAEFSKLAGITKVHLSNIECAHTSPSLAVMLKCARVIGCGVDALLWDNYEKNRQVFEDQFATLVSDCNEYELKLFIGAVTGIKEQVRAVERHREWERELTSRIVCGNKKYHTGD
jgi:transcriptional regulator with XRE-family HTH domain